MRGRGQKSKCSALMALIVRISFDVKKLLASEEGAILCSQGPHCQRDRRHPRLQAFDHLWAVCSFLPGRRALLLPFPGSWGSSIHPATLLLTFLRWTAFQQVSSQTRTRCPALQMRTANFLKGPHPNTAKDCPPTCLG